MSFKPPFARMREIHANIVRDDPAAEPVLPTNAEEAVAMGYIEVPVVVEAPAPVVIVEEPIAVVEEPVVVVEEAVVVEEVITPVVEEVAPAPAPAAVVEPVKWPKKSKKG